MTKKIVFLGGPSTGKTTLCKALAHKLDTLWVAEYGREYWPGLCYIIHRNAGTWIRHYDDGKHLTCLEYFMKLATLLFILLSSIPALCFADDPIPKVSKGKMERVENFKSAYVEDRYLNVWLPPGYNTAHTYDVLYMHDGRMLFDANTTWNKQEWQVDEVAGSLIEQQKVRPFIVVGKAFGYTSGIYVFTIKPCISPINGALPFSSRLWGGTT